MKVRSIIKKLSKTYSVVIIPDSNACVRKLSVKAPLLKLLIVLILLASITASLVLINSPAKIVNELNAEKESNESLLRQIDNLSKVIDQQNKTLVLNKNQVEQLQKNDEDAQSKIQDFIKMYTAVADGYTTKTNRGSSAQNISRELSDLTELSSYVEKLSEAYNPDAKLAAQLKESSDKLEKYMDAIPTLIPAKGKITSPFGMRYHPIEKINKVHQGVDINASYGDPILAAASGTIEISGIYGGYGKCVIIDHGNGCRTIYGHSSKLLVKEGQTVKKGQKIALVGSTGLSTGPHLHFEIRVGNTPVDPTQYVDFGSAK